jgi:hypothetical protein
MDTSATVSALATGFGTLVLAVATFAAVRSAHRAARAAERSLLAGLRPLLVPSRLEDGAQKVFFPDDWHAMIPGGGAGGPGGGGRRELRRRLPRRVAAQRRQRDRRAARLAVLPGDYRSNEHPDPGTFARQARDLYIPYIPAGDTGFWMGALRDSGDANRDAAAKAIANREPLTIDLLYGDYQGGQRVISRFLMRPGREDARLLSVVHHWNVDRPDPR